MSSTVGSKVLLAGLRAAEPVPHAACPAAPTSWRAPIARPSERTLLYSYSRLRAFENCPLQFRYRYLDRIQSEFESIEAFNGKRVITVTYHCGAREPFKNRIADDVRKDLEDKGSPVVICSHALSGLERSVAKKHSGVYPVLLIADTLRLLGQGTKIAVEVAVMAVQIQPL